MIEPQNLRIHTHPFGTIAVVIFEDDDGMRYRLALAANEDGSDIARPYKVETSGRGKWRDGPAGQWLRKSDPNSPRGLESSLDANSKKWKPLVDRLLAWVEEGDELEKARQAAREADEARREEKEADKEAQTREALEILARDEDTTVNVGALLLNLQEHASRDELKALRAALARI